MRGRGAFRLRAPGQAQAAWQWVNFLCEQVPPGRESLLLNLDETAVPFYHGDVKGTLLVSKRQRRLLGEPVQRVPRRQRRSNLTHVAIIAERRDVQAALPHIFLGNPGVLRVRDQKAVQADLPSNVRLVRAASSWTTIESMVELMRDLGKALTPWKATHQPILLMDCAAQHLHVRVPRAAARAGIWIAYVPAGLTWLLQPCDTHVFLEYKRYLRSAYADIRANSASGEIPCLDWLRAVAQAVPQVLEARPWHHAFRENGFRLRQTAVSSFVRRQLGNAESLSASADEPLAEDVAAVLPRGCTVPYNALLGPARARLALADGAAPDEASEEAEPPAAGRWAGRLRSGSVLAAAAAEESPPPPVPPPAAPQPGQLRRPRAWPMEVPMPAPRRTRSRRTAETTQSSLPAPASSAAPGGQIWQRTRSSSSGTRRSA